MIFVELSRQYLKEWGANWIKEAPQRFVYLDRFQSELFPDSNRKIVVVSQILPANSTVGYEELSYLTVQKVNGKEINSLADLAQAVAKPIEGGFIRIETQEDPKELELNAEQIAAEGPALQQSYGISSLQRLENGRSSNRLDVRACCSPVGQEPCHFVDVGFERIAHDEKIAAVAGDRVPVDHVGQIALSENAATARARPAARVFAGGCSIASVPAHAVIPFADSFARRDAERRDRVPDRCCDIRDRGFAATDRSSADLPLP